MVELRGRKTVGIMVELRGLVKDAKVHNNETFNNKFAISVKVIQFFNEKRMIRKTNREITVT